MANEYQAPRPLHINIPISKVDEEQRMVWGYATLEEVDSHGEIIKYDASKKAFASWIGNIREMHEDKAVGKGVEIQYDDDNKGVWLGSKISESADGENAWVKVKEGILCGYSIGGSAKAFEMVKVGDEDHLAITDYTLGEVSLVDNPACPGATFQMVKSAGSKLQRTETLTNGDDRPVAWWERMFKYSPSQSIRKTVTVYNNSMDLSKQFTKADFGDVSYLSELAMELSWYLRSEQFEGDQPTVDAIAAALKGLKAAISSELVEDDQEEMAGVIANAVKAINLKKESSVKKTVTGSEDRDHKAEVVLSEEQTGRPVNDTHERAAAAGVPAAGEVVENEDGDKEVQPLVHAKSEDAGKPAEGAATVNEDGVETKPETPEEAGKEGAEKASKKVEVKVENKAPVDFTKSLSAITDALKEVTDVVGKVAKSQDALTGRIDALEGKPAASKVAKGAFVDVDKAEEARVSEQETELKDLLKQADEMAADPAKGTTQERTTLAVKIRKAQRAMDPASVQKANEIRNSFVQ